MAIIFHSITKFYSTPNPLKITTKASSKTTEKVEIRVCTNRTCRKQGSFDVLQVLSGIAPPQVEVNSCSCLGKCGTGPNVVILPEGVFVGHCGTPKRAGDVMSYVCGVSDGEAEESVRVCLEALALRKRAVYEMGRGDFSLACSLLSQAVELKPFGGLHLIYMTRSAARLGLGDITRALEDTKEALSIAPYCSEAYICEGDVLMAMNEFDAANESYSIALELDPSIRRAKPFKTRISKLQEKLMPSNLG